MDFIEGLPKSQGKDVIFVVVDKCFKYAHFLALSHPYTAVSVAQAFMDGVFKLHGMPEMIVSDRDPVFLSGFWQEMFKLQGVGLATSSAYHPQSDGQSEIVNKCLETYLRCMTTDKPYTWVKWLPLAEWWYNTTYHIAIKITPFEALYGFPPPLHMPYFPRDSSVASVDSYLKDKESMIQLLKHHLQRARDIMKFQADKKRSERSFLIGDWVYLKLQPYKQESMGKRSCQKLSPRYYGPFKILDKIGEVAYKLELPSSSQIHHTFHVSQLRKAIGSATTTQEFPLPQELVIAESKQPLAILERKMVKRGNKAAAQLLIHWSQSSSAEATWEFTDEIRMRFPHFNLEDKKS
ncbi:hypothetical protein CRG98_001861 [Punica granatum]|uniref:Integrase catalytic domain-containing protein n=1 Tax=Punica granatum TaxID=22663 RepID=A0A2I0LAM6_PUNGR|nr:hypothetical protein CRG98_001861 [Punica granatum]